MSKGDVNCVLLADSHHGLSEGIRSLLATTFETVVMVADEASLFRSAGRLESDVAVVDLALSRGNALEFVRRLRRQFPDMKLIIVSVHDQSSVSRSVLGAGANAFVVKHAIATDLLAATDAVLAGQSYVSPEITRRECETRGEAPCPKTPSGRDRGATSLVNRGGIDLGQNKTDDEG